MSGDEYKRGYSAGFADGIEAAQKAITKIAASAEAAYNNDHYHNDHPEWGEHVCGVCGMVTRGIVLPSCNNNLCPHPELVIEYPEHLGR